MSNYKKAIYIPVELDWVKCSNVECEMKFSVITMLGEGWVCQLVEICPYCGSRIIYPIKSGDEEK